MIAAEVQFYDVVLWVHITAVVLAWGPTFAYPVFFATAGRVNPAALPTLAHAVLTWSRTATRLNILLLIVSGLYLTDDRWDFGDFFVSWGLASVLILLAMLEFFFIPNTKKFISAAEGGRQEEAMALAARQRMAGPIAGLLVIVTIYVMTAQPFL